jgi:large subunit ribosomal protein L11
MANVTHFHRTFSYVMKSPPSSYFLKQAAGLAKGASQPGKQKVGKLTLKHIYEIAVIKKQDPFLAEVPLQGMCRCLIGSARTMGIEVVKSI